MKIQYPIGPGIPTPEDCAIIAERLRHRLLPLVGQRIDEKLEARLNQIIDGFFSDYAS